MEFLGNVELHSGGELSTTICFARYPRRSRPASTSHSSLGIGSRASFHLQFHHMKSSRNTTHRQRGDRYFGILCLRVITENYSDIVGLRNSHDKSFPIGVAFGSSVFVCSNLAFVADHVVKRKHTVRRVVSCPSCFKRSSRRSGSAHFAKYEAAHVPSNADRRQEGRSRHQELYRQDVIGVQAIAHVAREWETPSHDWGDKTACAHSMQLRSPIG